MFLLLCPLLCFSQELLENTAILKRGPYEIRGIKLLPPNSLTAFRALYRIDQEEVEVIFTPQSVLIPREWLPLSCRGLKVYQIPWNEYFSVCYRSEQNTHLFFIFENAEYWCLFIEKFVQRFSVVMGFTRYNSDILFPAVLEF